MTTIDILPKVKFSAVDNSFCCNGCFAITYDECICNSIIGYDEETGYAIVDLTDEDLRYLHSVGDSSADSSKKIIRMKKEIDDTIRW
jgi:hypothetical protein